MSKKRKIVIAVVSLLGAIIIGLAAFLIYWKTPYHFKLNEAEVESIIIWQQPHPNEEVSVKVEKVRWDELLSGLGAIEFHRYSGQFRCIPAREIRITLKNRTEYRITQIGLEIVGEKYTKVSSNDTLFRSLVEQFAAHPDVVRPYAEAE